MEDWETTGAAFPTVYHGGRTKIRSLDQSRLQARDAGFYGRGFYVTTSKSYAKTYGPVVSTLRLDPDARILVSSLKPEEAPDGLVNEIQRWLYERGIDAAKARGKEAQFEEEIARVTLDPLDWKNAVDRYGEAAGYDAVAHSAGEIVVKNLSKVKPVENG